MHHLESIVIHWTRQIKDVVNNDDNALNTEILGPLEEIEVCNFKNSKKNAYYGLAEHPTVPEKSTTPVSRNSCASCFDTKIQSHYATTVTTFLQFRSSGDHAPWT